MGMFVYFRYTYSLRIGNPAKPRLIQVRDVCDELCLDILLVGPLSTSKWGEITPPSLPHLPGIQAMDLLTLGQHVSSFVSIIFVCRRIWVNIV